MSLKMFSGCCLTLGNVFGLFLDSRPKVCGNFQAGAREGRCGRNFLSSKRVKTNKISSGAELLQVQVVGLLGWRGTTKRTGGSLYVGGWFWVDGFDSMIFVG